MLLRGSLSETEQHPEAGIDVVEENLRHSTSLFTKELPVDQLETEWNSDGVPGDARRLRAKQDIAS